MTKTTEELKRDLYHGLTLIKNDQIGGMFHFENALEAYLEALRKERAQISLSLASANSQGEILLDAYSRQINLAREAREEADRERNRCQAFEFANKSAGEFLKESQRLLKEARESVKRQRQSIGQLKRDRNNAQHTLKVRDRQLLEARMEPLEARKHVPATLAQADKENAACVKCGGTETVLCGADVPGAFLFLDDCHECGERS